MATEPSAYIIVPIARGARRVLRFTMTTNGSVSGWTTRFTARAKATSPDPPALDIEGTIADAGSPTTPGVFHVVVTKDLSLALEKRIYACSFTRVDTDAEDLLARGIMPVDYDIRNAA